MKATILLAFCILCGESKLLESLKLTEASSSALHSVIGTAVRHKRQQPGFCSQVELSLRVNAAICNPNIGQRNFDVNLDCDSIYTRSLVGMCAINENGRLCFEFIGTLFSNYTNALNSNCPSLSNYSNYECSDSCRVALQNLKSNVGCCLNSLFNNPVYGIRMKLNRADLWSACSVSPPSFCQANTLMLGSGTTSRNCSNVEALEQVFTQIYCNSQFFQPVLDVYMQCEPSDVEYFVGICGLSENNQLCAVLLNNSYPATVESQCQNYYTEGCTPSCYGALNTFKTATGCCVNVYNSSLYNYRLTTNPDLWSVCGIPTPGFCPSTLVSQPTRSPTDSMALPLTTSVPTLSSQPTSTSESNSALSLDSPSIVMMIVPLVLLNVYM